MTIKTAFIACGIIFALTAGVKAAAPPALDGLWQVISPVASLTTADGKPPPLTAGAQKQYDQRRAQFRAGDKSFDTTLKCKPMGEPRTAYDAAGGPFEITQNAKELVFGYTWNRMVRFIYLSKKAPDVIGPSYYGTSTGSWIGRKLLVDTEGLHDSTLLDASGMPHTENLKLRETFELADQGQTLNETIRFEDPATFLRPWETKITYRKLPPDTRLVEDVCIERLHVTGY